MAADERQHEVEYDEIDIVAVEHAQCVKAIPGFDNAVTLESERRPEHPAEVEVVFDNEYRLHTRYAGRSIARYEMALKLYIPNT